ncbi:MAG: RluA family pseudouridine synthase [Thermoguttaceae bacterium]
MQISELEILFEDNHLLVVVKPVGIATMGLEEGEETLLTVAKQYVKEKYQKPGNVYLGVVSRLDVPVSGVVLFARTSKAAERINRQFREHSVCKHYAAIVAGFVSPSNGQCVDWICEDKRHRRVWIAGETDRARNENAKEARLHYRLEKRLGPYSLLHVELETGRKHQIRLQLSKRGFPILGDRKYGSEVILPKGITLHARELTVEHPITNERLTWIAPFPAFWRKFLAKET